MVWSALLFAAAQLGPTSGQLPALRTWKFLGPSALSRLDDLESALKKEDWTSSLRINIELLPKGPALMYEEPPKAPMILVSSSGESVEPPRVVDGWRWQLETGWLAVYAENHAEASRRFKAVIEGCPRLAGKGWEGLAMSQIRARDFRGAEQSMAAAGTLNDGMKFVLGWAMSSSTERSLRLHDLAMAGQVPVANASLQGQIGGGQLPSTTSARLPSSPGISSAMVEAALILAQEARRDRDAKRVTLYTNRALYLCREALPHHRMIARIYAKPLQ